MHLSIETVYDFCAVFLYIETVCACSWHVRASVSVSLRQWAVHRHVPTLRRALRLLRPQRRNKLRRCDKAFLVFFALFISLTAASWRAKSGWKLASLSFECSSIWQNSLFQPILNPFFHCSMQLHTPSQCFFVFLLLKGTSSALCSLLCHSMI